MRFRDGENPRTPQVSESRRPLREGENPRTPTALHPFGWGRPPEESSVRRYSEIPGDSLELLYEDWLEDVLLYGAVHGGVMDPRGTTVPECTRVRRSWTEEGSLEVSYWTDHPSV